MGHSSWKALYRLTRARGLRFDRVNPTEDLLLPPEADPEALPAYRTLLDNYAARLILKEVVNADSTAKWRKGRRALERFCRPEAIDQYLLQMEDCGVIRNAAAIRPVPTRPVTGFGATYEWYVSRVLAEDFGCAAAWGVRFADRGSGGDHDVVADLSGRFLYMEVKTAPPKHIEQPEVSGFVRRLLDISPDIAILHDDTHLRMKDKLVPLLEEGLRTSRPPGAVPLRLRRLEREIFHFEAAIYVVNSKPDLRRNLEAVFHHHFRSRSRVVTAVQEPS